jgi:hypothetical protein
METIVSTQRWHPFGPTNERKSTFRDEVPISITKVTICFLSAFAAARRLNRYLSFNPAARQRRHEIGYYIRATYQYRVSERGIQILAEASSPVSAGGTSEVPMVREKSIDG